VSILIRALLIRMLKLNCHVEERNIYFSGIRSFTSASSAHRLRQDDRVKKITAVSLYT
jgi:hypothetical protein